MVKACEECDTIFNAPRTAARFCSRKCAGAWRGRHLQRREKRTCPVCSKVFEVGGRTGRRRDRTITCSWACQRRSRYRHGVRAKKLSTADAAYLAGLLDGEGSIFFAWRNEGVHLRVAVTNTHAVTLGWSAEITGVGKVQRQYTEGAPSRVAKHRQATFQWVLNAEAAESLLHQLRPHLKIKTAQAALAIETQERLRNPALKADRGWQAEYRDRMKTLNHRSPAA